MRWDGAGTALDQRRSIMMGEAMPTEVEAPRPMSRLGPIRSPQNFFAGLALIGIAAFAIWATSDLSQGTLRAMGPAMLPRWLAIGVGTCGLLLAILAFFSGGDPLRLSDYSALVTFAVVLSIAAIAARVVNALFYDGKQGANVFFYTVIILFYGTIFLMFVTTLRRSTWLETRGLRGPFFIVAGILSFAITIRLFGLVVAGPLAMIIGGYATSEVREKEIIIFAAIMTAFCVGLFRYVLNLPIPIIIIPGIIHI
jgi:Tripartite tricarboxylate transporter TctB family